MSTPVVRLTEITPHPNAERLELLHLSNGVTLVSGKHYKPGILGVYIPPGMMLPGWMAEDLWLMGRATAMRLWFVVREIELRGVKSPGLFAGSVWSKDTTSRQPWQNWQMWRQGWREGDDVSTYLGIFDPAWAPSVLPTGGWPTGIEGIPVESHA